MSRILVKVNQWSHDLNTGEERKGDEGDRGKSLGKGGYFQYPSTVLTVSMFAKISDTSGILSNPVYANTGLYDLYESREICIWMCHPPLQYMRLACNALHFTLMAQNRYLQQQQQLISQNKGFLLFCLLPKPNYKVLNKKTFTMLVLGEGGLQSCKIAQRGRKHSLLFEVKVIGQLGGGTRGVWRITNHMEYC